MPDTARVISRWTVTHSVLTLLGLVASLLVQAPLPSLLVGSTSLGFFFLRHRSPGWANLVTALRAALMGVAVTTAWHRPNVSGLAALTSLVLDGVDGWVARRRQEASSFGASFDLETDAWTVLLLTLVLVFSRGYGAWVCIAGVLRYAFVLARALSPVPARPEPRSRIGRWAYFYSLFSLLVACLPGPPRLQGLLLVTGVVALCLSFARSFRELVPPGPVMKAPSSTSEVTHGAPTGVGHATGTGPEPR